MADLFSQAKTAQEKLALLESIPVATASLPSGTLAIEKSEVDRLRGALESGDTARFNQLFSKVQQNFEGAFEAATEKLKNAQLNFANVSDFSALSPEQQGEITASSTFSEKQTEVQQQQSQLQQFADIFGVEVPDFSSTFVSAGDRGIVTPETASEITGVKGASGQTAMAVDITQQQDGTYAVVNKLTGDTLQGGFNSPGEANAYATEVQSGSRPDEVGAFAQTEAKEATGQLMDTVMSTKGSLSANADFVNGAFQAFLGRDATQAELDRFTGQTVDAVRNALKTGASGEMSSGDITVDLPTEFDTDTLSDILSDPVTDSDIASFLTEMEKAQEEFLATLTPTQEETDLKSQLAELRASYEMGLADIADQPIPMQFITGQQASLERRAQAAEGLLLERLGLAQEARATEAGIAEAKLGFIQSNFQTQLQISQMLQQQEDAAFARASALRTEQRENLVMILNMMQGVYEEDLTDQQRDQLMKLSQEAGISYSLVASGMDTVANQVLFDTMMETSGAADGLPGSFLTSEQLDQLDSIAGDMRQDQQIKDFIDAQGSVERIRQGEALDSAQGDIAIIFGYMKMLDPTSTVREGEFATAQNSGGVADSVRNFYNKAVSGERLTASQRSNFVDAAEALFSGYESAYNSAFEQYSNRAALAGLEPSLLRDYAVPETQISVRSVDKPIDTYVNAITGRTRADGSIVSQADALSIAQDAKELEQRGYTLEEIVNTINELMGYPPKASSSLGSVTAISNLPGEQSQASSVLGSGVVTGYGSKFWSPGLDYVLPGGKNAKVQFPVSVRVKAVVPESSSKGFGNQVQLVMPDGKELWVSHLDSVYAKAGMLLPAGTAIGTQGNTGKTYGRTGIHLDLTMPKPGGGYYSAEQVAGYLKVKSIA